MCCKMSGGCKIKGSILTCSLISLLQRVETRKQKEKNVWSERFSIGDRFDPKDVSIKTTGDAVTVTAKREHRHEDDSSEGYGIEQTSRTVRLPKDVNPESVKAYISSDGDLKLIGHRDKAITGCKGPCTSETKECKSVDCKLKDMASEAASGTEKEKESQEPTNTTPTEELPGYDASEMESTDQKSSEKRSDRITDESMETDFEEPAGELSREVAKVEDSEPWSMQLNLEGFQPEDLNVKVTGNLVTVTAEHKEENDGFWLIW